MTGSRHATRIDVVVPAHDEADRIAACLDALVAATEHLAAVRPEVAVTVTVVLDGCTDGTAAVVAAYPVEAVTTSRVGVGRARSTGVAHALRRHPGAPHQRWLAHTDADSRVPVGWLAQQAEALASGAAVLVGAVVPDPDDLEPAVLDRWRRAHPPGAALGHVHGANLGVLAAAYVTLGGFDPVPEHEDARLVARARALGLRVDATVDLPVVTSGRFEGRTPGGYAEHLRQQYGGAS